MRMKEDYDKSRKCKSGLAYHELETDCYAVEYSQIWRPSREHEFPLDLPLLYGYEEVKALWEKLLSQDGGYQRE